MTDKEPIIIDGVDVSKCKYLPYCNDKQGNCAFEPNCYFKQLARKTQECEQKQKIIEELKKQLETSEKWRIKAESLNEKLNLENTCYRKALEEIEGLISDYEFIRCPINDDVNCNYFTRNKILDIINKAKEENNGINDNSK